MEISWGTVYVVGDDALKDPEEASHEISNRRSQISSDNLRSKRSQISQHQEPELITLRSEIFDLRSRGWPTKLRLA